MSGIRLGCNGGHDVIVAPDQVRVIICDATDESSYVFRCTMCGAFVMKPVDRQAIQILQSSGVHCTRWRMPLGIATCMVSTNADLLELRIATDGVNWLESLAKTPGGIGLMLTPHLTLITSDCDKLPDIDWYAALNATSSSDTSA